MSLNRVRALLVALFVALSLGLGACGGSDDPPPYASAQEVAVAYTKARNLFYEPDYNQFQMPDGRYHVVFAVNGQVIYDEILFDFSYQEGITDDGTQIHVVWNYRQPGITTYLFVGKKQIDLSEIVAERAGKARQILVYDVRKGPGDWYIVAGNEEHFPEDPDYGKTFYHWSAVNAVTGDMVNYGYYSPY